MLACCQQQNVAAALHRMLLTRTRAHTPGQVDAPYIQSSDARTHEHTCPDATGTAPGITRQITNPKTN
jgi:hypothetical protein